MNFDEWAKSSKWNFDSSEYAKDIKGIAKAAWEAAQPKWQPIETAPRGKSVLVFYKNRAGMGRIIKAEYIEKHTEEASEACINIDFFDYCEEKDEYFTPEGWYEIIDNGHEYSSYALETGNNPTHWILLPEPPQEVVK